VYQFMPSQSGTLIRGNLSRQQPQFMVNGQENMYWVTYQILTDTTYGLNSTERVFEICSGATRSLAYMRRVCCYTY